MLVLLPPSEGKTVPTRGPRLDLDRLSLPSLTEARRRVLSSLVDLTGSEPEQARRVLGLSDGQADQVALDAVLPGASCAPAGRVYSGVLYAALDRPGLDARARRRIDAWALVFSGLWGVVRLTDPIPGYRLSGAVTLPGVGRLPGYWRPHLTAALADRADRGLVVDLRSSTYSPFWTGPAGRTATVRVLHDGPAGRTVASHANKATKGRLVRSLAESSGTPRDVDDLVDVLRAAGWQVSVPVPVGRVTRLDVVVAHL